VTDLLQRVREKGNPLVNEGSATFVWHGKQGVHLISDLSRWENAPQALKKIAPETWATTLELPVDAYLEYAFYDPQSEERLPDPFNKKNKVFNGLGDFNHFFYMPGVEPTPYTELPQTGLRGKITRHTLQVDFPFTVKKIRHIYLYRPPVDTAVPLLVVYDGLDYMRRGRLANIVDNLTNKGLMQPIALAFLPNGGSRGRFQEFDCSRLTTEYLKQYILPLARKELNLQDHERHPGIHGILGSSMGGLMAAFTALREPQIFGRALCQAGAYQYFAGDAIIMDMVRFMPRPEIKLWLDCGRFDFLLDANRNFVALLQEKGYEFRYKENGGAHNQTTWRNAAVEGLQFLFPA
jgi:enterochelin esterase family protein